MTKKLQSKGFTIIEAMIVLAIAGVILAAVLFAVPQLQRNQRNTSRKNDASRVATAVNTYVSNNNGTSFPVTGGTASAALTSLKSEIGTLGEYDTANIQAVTFVTDVTIAVDDRPTIVKVVVSATCNGAAAVSGTSRQIAVLYGLEKSGNTYDVSCLAI